MKRLILTLLLFSSPSHAVPRCPMLFAKADDLGAATDALTQVVGALPQRSDPRRPNFAVITISLIRILQKWDALNLADLEEVLRENESRLYLLAKPIELFTPDTIVELQAGATAGGVAAYSLKGEELPYALYVHLSDNPDEASALLRSWGILPGANLQNLKHTGFLRTRPRN